jgi:hypothetical protein
MVTASAVRSGMRNRWADEFERSLRSEACADGRHDECPHLDGFVTGLNPRRLRFESGAGLCKCDCHSSCTVTSSNRVAVSVKTWRECCTCPGAAAERVRRQELESALDAAQAVREIAAGKSREQIKDLYLAELRGRGLTIPEDFLDAQVDALAGNLWKLPGLFRRPR